MQVLIVRRTFFGDLDGLVLVLADEEENQPDVAVLSRRINTLIEETSGKKGLRENKRNRDTLDVGSVYLRETEDLSDCRTSLQEVLDFTAVQDRQGRLKRLLDFRGRVSIFTRKDGHKAEKLIEKVTIDV